MRSLKTMEFTWRLNLRTTRLLWTLLLAPLCFGLVYQALATQRYVAARDRLIQNGTPYCRVVLPGSVAVPVVSAEKGNLVNNQDVDCVDPDEERNCASLQFDPKTLALRRIGANPYEQWHLPSRSMTKRQGKYLAIEWMQSLFQKSAILRDQTFRGNSLWTTVELPEKTGVQRYRLCMNRRTHKLILLERVG